jgi:hypothetical protein
MSDILVGRIERTFKALAADLSEPDVHRAVV